MKSSNKKILIILGNLLIVCLILLFIVRQTESQDLLEVIFFDVGQGDSILIKTPSHHTILIDGGPGTSVVSKLGNHLPFYQQKIDLIILTHAHEDHLAGLIGVVNKYEVGQVIYSDVKYSSSSYKEWQSIMEIKDMIVTEPIFGQEYKFGEVALEILYPFDKYEETPEDINDTSVVSKLIYQDTSFLFTGDASIDVEEKLLENNIDINSNVLKVAHHGSKYSSSFDFLEAVDPDYAVIQSGEGNSFGHPHKLTLNKLNGYNIEIFRNDEIGDVIITSDGEEVWVE
ncbi:MAG: ComEC/Rec2 family competence protein [Candidatus Kerfeldbacteria bacterium]